MIRADSRRDRQTTVRLRVWMLLAALCAASVLSLSTVRAAGAQELPHRVDEEAPRVYLPHVSSRTDPAPSCRFGVNVAHAPVTSFDLAGLRIGWYIDYRAQAKAAHPNGAAYTPVINLEQVGESGYTASPSGDALDAAIADNLGADWIIGNEPDRRYYQNDMTPKAYARAYHDLYAYIKARDATARIFAGAIVQPTPLRLRYLDEVLRHYRELYGESLPADGWAVHNFILNERSCAYYKDPAICWGADIPPGIDARDGLVINPDQLEKTADVAFFKEQVIRFRQWMADKGYRNRPLYVSEFGILMPESYGFSPAVVNNYMNQTFGYLLTAKDDTLGYAADDYRLVQRLAWYSTADPAFNGSLFQSATDEPLAPPFVLTSMGENFRAYAETHDTNSSYKLLGVTQQVLPSAAAGAGVTVTLQAAVANAGSNQWPAGATVTFYLGDPAAGGTVLGSTGVEATGCGTTATATFVWQDVPLSAHGQVVYARLVAPGVDTKARVQIVRAQNLLSMPLVRQALELAKQ